MALTLLTPPGEEPLALAELKFYIRVSHDTDDILIADLARAAREQIEAVTGLALVTQDWRLTLDRWPEMSASDLPLAGGSVALLRPPVQAITGISVQTGDGSWVELDTDHYTLVAGYPARVRFRTPPPAPAVQTGGIRIDFTAGFGAPGDVPATLKQAMRLLAAHYHENRVPVSHRRETAMPHSVAALLAPWREVRL